MNKYLKSITLILLFLIFIVLCLLFALQYNSICQTTLTYHMFDLPKSILIFLHTLIKDFSWSFLILLLFCIPSCKGYIVILVDKFGEMVANYSIAIGNAKIETQTKNEQRDFKEEQNIQLKSNISEAEKYKPYKERQNLRDKLIKLLEKEIKNNYDDFISNSKLIFTHDPVLSSGSLLFDSSYRFGRRYINRLYIPNTIYAINDNRYYKYIRIMNDINKERKNQRYAVELVILSLDEKDTPTLFNKLKDSYAEALDRGILCLREYKIKNDSPELVKNAGWILGEELDA